MDEILDASVAARHTGHVPWPIAKRLTRWPFRTTSEWRSQKLTMPLPAPQEPLQPERVRSEPDLSSLPRCCDAVGFMMLEDARRYGRGGGGSGPLEQEKPVVSERA